MKKKSMIRRIKVVNRWLRLSWFKSYRQMVRRVEHEIGGEIQAC